MDFYRLDLRKDISTPYQTIQVLLERYGTILNNRFYVDLECLHCVLAIF